MSGAGDDLFLDLGQAVPNLLYDWIWEERRLPRRQTGFSADEQCGNAYLAESSSNLSLASPLCKVCPHRLLRRLWLHPWRFPTKLVVKERLHPRSPID